jgi:hypothetical protein
MVTRRLALRWRNRRSSDASGDEIADQLGPQQVHRRSGDLDEQHGPVAARAERLELQRLADRDASRADVARLHLAPPR